VPNLSLSIVALRYCWERGKARKAPRSIRGGSKNNKTLHERERTQYKKLRKYQNKNIWAHGQKQKSCYTILNCKLLRVVRTTSGFRKTRNTLLHRNSHSRNQSACDYFLASFIAHSLSIYTRAYNQLEKRRFLRELQPELQQPYHGAKKTF